MAIGSAAIMFNIDFVLDNLEVRHYFKAIVSGWRCCSQQTRPWNLSEGGSIAKHPAS